MTTSLDARLLSGDVPDALRGIVLDRPWDLGSLLALQLPVGVVEVEPLSWQLDLPWWRVGDRWFVVSPNQVRTEPHRYPAQWARTMDADLDAPIHVRRTDRGPVILDGVHRLLRASVEARRSLPVRWVRMADLLRIYV